MPLATVLVDHETVQEVYDQILNWLALPSTNKARVGRIAGISRNTINRYILKEGAQEPLTTSFIKLVKAYEIMEKGYNDPENYDEPEEVVET